MMYQILIHHPSQSMFAYCEQLTSLNLSSFDTSSVRNMQEMFYQCKKLTSLNLSNFIISEGVSVNIIFTYCEALEYLDISNFNFLDYYTYGKMFDYVANIKYIGLGNVENTYNLQQEIQNSNFNSKNDLIICQKDNIINNPNALYTCCDFSKSPLKCDSKFISVKCKDKVNYDSGFINQNIPSRDLLFMIINQDSILKGNDSFIVEANNSIDIFFINTATLEKYFDSNIDKNAKSIIYADLSHINSSIVTSTKQMFLECDSIKEINIGNFQTLNVEDMSEMFSGCSQLTSLNLSTFDTSLVKNMTNMFYGCGSLEYLDISNFETSSSGIYTNMFQGADIIKYISIYKAKNNEAFESSVSSSSNLNEKDELTVCQKDDIISNQKAFYECCDYWDYNFELLRCDPDNYFRVKFKNEVKYPYGFGFVEYDQSPNEFRTEIYFIKYKHDKYKPDESLIIPKDEEIRIVFNSSLTNTTKFFYDYLDQNVEHIILIDLSHFNSSILESADRMFSGCTSLEYIDMSNFNAPLIKNMSNMFFHCDSLKGIDLSKLNSSALTDINKMFCGCASLEYLILDGLDFSKVKDASYLFYNVKNLKLINIYDIKYNDIFMDEINELNELENENIFVSQKEELLTNPNYKYIGSNIEKNESECHSYIIVYYKEAIEYESGFIIEGINSRNNILFIINEGNINGTNEKLTISENSSIKLCLKNSVTSLESFFDVSKDTKTQKILSIDFSHFDSSSVNNIDNIFSGCQNLLAVDMSNFNLENIKSSKDTFKDTENLKYISFNGVANYIANLSNIDLNGIKELNLTICQTEKILEFDNFKNICCEFNLELEMCHSNNYITVKYKESSVYDNGYKNEPGIFLNPERSGVNYIIKGNSLFSGDEPLTIEVNESIEIHFYPNITSLNAFFMDQKVQSVISINLSHFDSSSLKDMGYMFCFTSIEEIDFTNFDSSMVTNMDSCFIIVRI